MAGFNFNNVIGNSSVNVTCPKCSTKFPITLNQVGSSVICTGCKSTIALQKSDNFDKSKSDIDKSFNDLNKTLKTFGK